MKFDYCVGNPPYQETKKTNNTTQLWPNFIKESTKIADKSCMIHPGRWIVPKKNMIPIRDEIINNNLKAFSFYPNSETVFNGIAIDGGISITFFENNYNGNITYKIDNEDKGIYKVNAKFFSNAFEEELYSKVFSSIDTTNNMEKYKFSYNCGFNKSINPDVVKTTSEGMKRPIKSWVSLTFGKSESKFDWYYIDKDDLINPDEELFLSKKVIISSTGNSILHRKNVYNNVPVICDRDTIGDKVYYFFPKTERERELQLIKSLLMTKTARYLMSITQKGVIVMGFENIPDYLELAKLLPENELFTDEWFYKTFDFSEGLINEIETRVSPKVDKEA